MQKGQADPERGAPKTLEERIAEYREHVADLGLRVSYLEVTTPSGSYTLNLVTLEREVA